MDFVPDTKNIVELEARKPNKIPLPSGEFKKRKTVQLENELDFDSISGLETVIGALQKQIMASENSVNNNISNTETNLIVIFNAIWRNHKEQIIALKKSHTLETQISMFLMLTSYKNITDV